MSTYVLVDERGEQVGGSFYAEGLARASLRSTPGAVDVKELVDPPGVYDRRSFVEPRRIPFDMVGARAMLAKGGDLTFGDMDQLRGHLAAALREIENLREELDDLRDPDSE